jgi:hypothetical protein
VAKVFEQLDDRLVEWIGRQHLFFVGTAPAGAEGRVNVSPKGPGATLRVLGPSRIAYLDLVGSGVETIAHLRENGRIVVMLCAFEGPPRTVRLHGRGTVHELGDPVFEELAPEFALPEREPLFRSVVVVDVERIADSCGYGVPLMEYVGDRPQQTAWMERKLREAPDALHTYVRERNAESIDGLPGVAR